MPADADEVVWFIKNLRHTKGKYANQLFRLEPWQEAFIRNILALNRSGRRKVQRALLGIARKNGKTELIAALAIALMICDREPGGEIVGAASKRDQARLLLEAAKRMVWYSKINGRALSDFIVVRRDGLYFAEMDTYYRIVSADGEKEHGLNPSIVIFDELHAQGQRRDLWDALVTAQGAREDPMMISITTAGPEPRGICWDEYEYARKINNGTISDPTFLAEWYEADRELEVDDPKAWAQANPGYPTFVQADFLKRQAKDVLAGKLPEYTFRRLHLNQWTNALERWLPRASWEAGSAYPEIPEGATITIGLDAALKRDSYGVAIVYKAPGWVETEEGLSIPADIAHVRVKAFVPENEGEYINQEDVRTYLLGLSQLYRIEKLVYDPAYMQLMAEQLADAGMVIEPYPQSPEKMGFATETFQRLVLDSRLVHGNDRTLNEQLAAVGVRETDRAVRISKGKSGARIDVVVALVMALAEAFGGEAPQEDFCAII